MSSKNKYFKTVLKIIVSAVLIGFILTKVDKGLLFKKIALMDLKFVPVIILLIILNYVVSSIRWKTLLLNDKDNKAGVVYLTHLYFIGSFFNNFMPTSVGGDVYKIYKLGKKVNNNVDAFSATFMERFTGVLVLALISIFSLIKNLGFWIFPISSLFLLGIYFGFVILRVLGKKIPILLKIHDSLYSYKNHKAVVSQALFTSLIVQLIAILTQYSVFLALGVRLPILYSLLVFPVITLASFFIPSLNGIGVQDGLYISMFSHAGVSSELALSASILYHLFRLGVSLIGGVMYALGKAD